MLFRHLFVAPELEWACSEQGAQRLALLGCSHSFRGCLAHWRYQRSCPFAVVGQHSTAWLQATKEQFYGAFNVAASLFQGLLYIRRGESHLSQGPHSLTIHQAFSSHCMTRMSLTRYWGMLETVRGRPLFTCCSLWMRHGKCLDRGVVGQNLRSCVYCPLRRRWWHPSGPPIVVYNAALDPDSVGCPTGVSRATAQMGIWTSSAGTASDLSG